MSLNVIWGQLICDTIVSIVLTKNMELELEVSMQGMIRNDKTTD